MALVELNNILQGPDPGLDGGPREIGVQIGLQFVKQHLQLGIAIVANVGDVCGIDENSALPAQHLECFFSQAICGTVVAEEFPTRHTNPEPPQTSRLENLRVVCFRMFTRAGCRWVARIDTGHDTEKHGCVGHRAAERSGGVLSMRNRDNT
jgi:hypothetical protein